MQNTAELLVKCLENGGVDYIFELGLWGICLSLSFSSATGIRYSAAISFLVFI